MTVFLDANVVMYLIGAAHPHRDRAESLLDDLVLRDTRLVTDAEVFQEILHRYSAIRRTDAIEPAFATLTGLVDDVFPIGEDEVRAAKSLVLAGAGARDAVHVASMRTHQVDQILTFDRGFDRFDDLVRLS
ncbi:MAG: type II toxin-antitoxin system VapC family toxin [Microbacterium sp.]